MLYAFPFPPHLLGSRLHRAAYERSHPVVDFELTEDGPTYLVVGGAGNREGHAGERDQGMTRYFSPGV